MGNGCEALISGGDGSAVGGPLFVPAVANAIRASLANAATGHNKDENVEPTGPIMKGSPTGGGHPLPAVAFEWQRGATQNLELTDNFSPTLIKSQTPAVAFDVYNQSVSNVGQTLRRGTGRDQIGAVWVDYAVRRLTPVECERLQGFPDNFTGIPWKKKGPEHCPDGPRYKALGNSMAVPVMRWIGERIQIVDDLISLL